MKHMFSYSYSIFWSLIWISFNFIFVLPYSVNKDLEKKGKGNEEHHAIAAREGGYTGTGGRNSRKEQSRKESRQIGSSNTYSLSSAVCP